MDGLFVGIDPGLKGGIAILDHQGEVEKIARFDNQKPTAVIFEALKPYLREDIYVGLESVHAMPGQGVTSMFTFGVGYGRIMGFLDGIRVPFELHSPQAWQRWLPLGLSPKDRVRAYVSDFWGVERFIFANSRMPHGGCMDAACIAEYIRRLKNGQIEAPRVFKTKTKLKVLRL